MTKPIKIKIKAKEKAGVVSTKLLVKHPMESGLRKDKMGNKIPINHLREVKVSYKGTTVFSADMGIGVSKDPFLAFSFAGNSGEEIVVDVHDTNDSKGQVKAIIK